MPTLATGKKAAGFTLLEVLAVITLIGLTVTLAQPSLYLAPEKTAAQYIGKLLVADLDLLRDTAISNHCVQTVFFTSDGYYFELGDQPIRRDFAKLHFQFDNAATNQKTAAEMLPNEPPPDSVFQYNSDGATNGLHLTWHTANLHGSLTVVKEGDAVWSCTP